MLGWYLHVFSPGNLDAGANFFSISKIGSPLNLSSISVFPNFVVATTTSILIPFLFIVIYYRKNNIGNDLNSNINLNFNNLENFSSLKPLDIREFNAKILHREPNILLLDNFLSEEECAHIIKIGEPHIKKSEVCGKSGSRPDKSRTSMTAHIGKKFLTKDKKDKILMGILEKSANYVNRPVENIEPIQLVRYYPGQYFKSHYDYLDTRIPMYKENVAKNGQREFTFFVYLNDVPDNVGGETQFAKINKTFRAGKGQAVFWPNIVDGQCDKRTLHSGTELKKGIKYGLNIWVRDKEYKG